LKNIRKTLVIGRKGVCGSFRLVKEEWQYPEVRKIAFYFAGMRSLFEAPILVTNNTFIMTNARRAITEKARKKLSK